MFNKDQLNQLYRYALSLSTDEQTAYDLVQSGIERYLKKISGGATPVEKPLAYIKTIIRNCYYDLLRTRKVVPMVSIDSEDAINIEGILGSVDTDSMEDVLLNQQEVQQLLAGLSAQENELLYLWAVEEHTVEEISKIYAKPKGTMLSKLHRLKRRIRERMRVKPPVIESRVIDNE